MKISETISSLVTEQILFLPTYRRIEQELQSIFPGSDEEIQAIRRRLVSSRTGESFIELVEFGMEDVEKTIGARLDQIKEGVRTALNNLTGIYLRDVIRGVSHIDIEQLRNIDRSVLEDILIRIGEDILPSSDKQRLTERVEKMAERNELGAEDTAVAHFLLKLLALYKEQQEKERDVREFVEVCNGYLSGKQLVYDNKGYTIVIQPTKGWEEPPGSGEQALQFRMLSSGEKQIVSLFSHIYLSGRKGFFVIIDEPELSLSVPWQRRFLPDILRTNECTGLIAATHSPFIWENELEPYTKSLAEFVEGSGVVRR
jgi:putative AbiEii toxin of type IV toxin-antitoxin system